MRKTVLLALMVLVTAGSVQAAEPDESKPADKPKLICKTDRSTGSLTRRTRRCMTAEQWNAQTAAARQTADQIVRNGGYNNTQGGTNPMTGQ